MNFSKLPLFVKLIAVYLVSVLSFFILDFLLWIGIVSSGLNPVSFIFFLIMRVGLADLVSDLFLGTQVFNSPKFWASLILEMLIFGVPIISFVEAIPFGIIELLLPPYVSIMQTTLILALLYEFPRLILLIVVKRFLYGKIPAEGVR